MKNDEKKTSLISVNLSEQPHKDEMKDFRYDKPIEYWLLVIGYAIGYGSFWRFPYLIYSCGGGVFFIPFLIFFFLIAIPIFTLETIYGQIFKKGPVEMFAFINKKFKGIGWACIVISFIVSLYYAIILCWSVYFFFNSFISPLPWSREANLKMTNLTLNTTSNFSNSPLSDDFINVDFFRKEVLKLSDGIGNMGSINGNLAICLIITYILIYICISEGIKSSSKVVYITAPAPILLLLVLLFKAFTLPGIDKGLKYLFYPDITKLFDLDVWIKASNQVVFVLSVGMGGNIMFASYRKDDENIYFSSFWLPMMTVLFGILCAIINFSYLGHFSYLVNIPIDKLPLSGTDLAFSTYPSALCMLPFSNFWAIIFFFVLITLGIDSQFAFNENVTHYCYENFLYKYLSRSHSTMLICFIGFILGLPFIMEGGFYLFELVDNFATITSFAICFLECYLLTKYIGVDNIKELIHKKTGKTIPDYVYESIEKFAPYSLCGLFFFSFLQSIYPKHFLLWPYLVQLITVYWPLGMIVGFYYFYKDEPETTLKEMKEKIELSDLH